MTWVTRLTKQGLDHIIFSIFSFMAKSASKNCLMTFQKVKKRFETTKNRKLIRSVQLHYLSHVMANFTHEIEVSTALIKIQLGVYHEMMVQPVVLYNFFIQSLHFAGCFLQKIQTWKNFKFFTKNMEKLRFFDFFNFLMLESKKPFLLYRPSSNTFCWLILPKIKTWKNVKFFNQNHGL